MSGNTGTWEEDEADGEKESKSVTVNPDNQSLTMVMIPNSTNSTAIS
ncbi:MAG: hypothetical protein ACLTZB_06575 [Streptococcus salivarius]